MRLGYETHCRRWPWHGAEPHLESLREPMDVGRAHDQKPSLFLAKRPDVIAMPHIAGLTPDTAEHQAFDTVQQVRALLSGQIPEGAVNRSAQKLARAAYQCVTQRTHQGAVGSKSKPSRRCGTI
jgi:hypothetical protein